MNTERWKVRKIKNTRKLSN